MEFSEDFAAIQGILVSIHKTTGDFSAICYYSGNESKINAIADDLRNLLIRKKYLCEGKVNHKFENKIRKLILFFILNTELSNKALITNNHVAHLIGVIPQFSKCLLTFLVFKLDLCQYYGEAICSYPIQMSLELLEECSKTIKKSDPYAILFQTSTIASCIYYKMYHIRYENVNKLDNFLTKLLEKFNDILRNYITPVTDQILQWKTDKMYQYMGKAILEMLNLLKNCLNTFNMNEFVAPYYQFYQFSKETSHPLIDSPKTLNRSNEMLKEFNKHLLSVCEGNVVAVTISVFCAWTECKVDDLNLQEAVAYSAYEILDMLKSLEDVGDFPNILAAIARKPESLQDKIDKADNDKILENVLVKDENQYLWFKAFIKSKFLESEKSYDVFKSLIYLSDSEDYVNLLSLGSQTKHEFDLKEFLVNNLLKIPPEDSIEIISRYFNKDGINSNYEMKEFDVQVTELFNKLKCGESNQIPYKEISVLVLQNPIKFINNLLEESDKTIDHLSNILQILNYIKSICNIKCSDKEHTVLHEMILNKLKHGDFDPNSEICIVQFVNKLIKSQMLSNVITDQLQQILEESVASSNFKRAIFMCNLYQNVPIYYIQSDNYVSIILKLEDMISQLRWTFFTFSEEKVNLVAEMISLIYHFKANIHNEAQKDNLIKAAETLNNKINSFHIVKNLKNDCDNFLLYSNEDYDINSNHHEQVTRLINLLPRCVPLEWELVAKYLIANRNAISVIQLFIDVMLILSEMSKKSENTQGSLSYCFQQFCVIMKDIINFTNEKDEDLEKSFIKNICRLIKHLPDTLLNSLEISLVNLFNFDVLKSLKNDEDFVYSLVSISHLNICKIICNKMN